MSIGLAVVGIMSVLVLFMSYSHHQKQMELLLIDANRNYDLMPFDILDAERYCQLRLERRFGDDLAQSYIEDHSTRVDSKSGMYKIFMMAHVGTLREYEREAVHCFVDPHRRVLTHFRTINLKKASLMSRATKFFE